MEFDWFQGAASERFARFAGGVPRNCLAAIGKDIGEGSVCDWRVSWPFDNARSIGGCEVLCHGQRMGTLCRESHWRFYPRGGCAVSSRGGVMADSRCRFLIIRIWASYGAAPFSDRRRLYHDSEFLELFSTHQVEFGREFSPWTEMISSPSRT